MRKTYKFKIPVEPTGKQAPRFSRGKAYLPLCTRDSMDAIKFYVQQEFPREPLDCPVEINVTYVRHKPKYVPDWVKYVSRKPDLDNCTKLLGDALEGVLWSNDSRIVKANMKKVYCGEGEKPHINLEVRTITEAPWKA